MVCPTCNHPMTWSPKMMFGKFVPNKGNAAEFPMGCSHCHTIYRVSIVAVHESDLKPEAIAELRERARSVVEVTLTCGCKAEMVSTGKVKQCGPHKNDKVETR